jgi:hypothetical protein
MPILLQTEVNTHPLNSHSILFHSAPLELSVQTAAPGQIYQTRQTITNERDPTLCCAMAITIQDSQRRCKTMPMPLVVGCVLSACSAAEHQCWKATVT